MGPQLASLVIMNEVVASIMAIVEVGIWRLKVAWDRGSLFSQSSLKTKCSTINEYNEIHLGPEYELNERIAG